MKLYEIIGDEDTELEGFVFGQFSTRELAEKGYADCPDEIRESSEIVESNFRVNTIELDEKELDYTEQKDPEEVLALKSEEGHVEGYVHIHISDMIDNDYEGFLNILSEELIGNTCCLMDINYDVVSIGDEPNMLILKVSGYIDSN